MDMPYKNGRDPLAMSDIKFVEQNTPAQRTLAMSSCIGEQITSLRQLLKRFYGLNYFGASPIAAYTWTLRPFKIQWWGLNASTPAAITGVVTPDYYSLIGSCYSLARGSVRVRAVPVGVYNSSNIPYDNLLFGTMYADVSTNSGAFDLLTYDTTNDPATTVIGKQNPMVSYTITSVDGSGGYDVQVPAYSRTIARDTVLESITYSNLQTGGGLLNKQVFEDPANLQTSSNVLQFYSPGLKLPVHVMRAMGEDGGFFNFVSVPPLLFS